VAVLLRRLLSLRDLGYLSVVTTPVVLQPSSEGSSTSHVQVQGVSKKRFRKKKRSDSSFRFIADASD